jgi:hypothetical protein
VADGLRRLCACNVILAAARRVFPTGTYSDWRENARIENVIRARRLSLQRFSANSNSAADKKKVLQILAGVRRNAKLTRLILSADVLPVDGIPEGGRRCR